MSSASTVTWHVLSLVLVLCTGCASGSATSVGSSPSAAPAAAPRARQDQQLITRDVILGTQYTNLYEVVQALRSNWLRVRTSTNATGKVDALVVYLDNQRLGGPEEMRRIVPSSVASVRYFDPIAASARWGLDHGGGAIYVVSAR